MATTKYPWPLPGEAITAKELFAAELMAAIPGLKTYSEDGRLFALLTELIGAIYNGAQVLASLGIQGPLVVGADPGGAQLVRIGGDIQLKGNLAVPNGGTFNIGADALRLATIYATTFKGNGFNIDNNASASFTNQSSVAAGGSGTLTNAPSSGNPAFWLAINVNGVTRGVPCW